MKICQFLGLYFQNFLESVLFFFTIHIEEPKKCNDIYGTSFSQTLISSLSSVTPCLVGFYISQVLTLLPLFCTLLLWLVLHVSRNFLGNFLYLSSMNYVFNSIKYFYQHCISCYITRQCSPVPRTKPSTVLTTCMCVYQCGVYGYFSRQKQQLRDLRYPSHRSHDRMQTGV